LTDRIRIEAFMRDYGGAPALITCAASAAAWSRE
jgi:hypothetical protein